MKIIKYILDYLYLILYTMFIDQSLMQAREHRAAIAAWARGESKRLRFIPSWARGREEEQH